MSAQAPTLPAAPEDSQVAGYDFLHDRLTFFYQVITDTQNTIRFLDTKAAFCVTLVSGMTAVGLQHARDKPPVHGAVIPAFLVGVVCTVLICLRVIFPTVKVPAGLDAIPNPRFFIGHNKAHHWIRHVFLNPIDGVLSESQDSLMQAVLKCRTEDLLASLAHTVLMTAAIRQVKSDRLHGAMFFLVYVVLMFAAIVLG